VPVGFVDPLTLTIDDTSFNQVESRGDFAAITQTTIAKV
jgi:hypothetical protein